MKPRSIIFMIFAAVLILAGVITCLVCGSLASSKNIELLSDTIDAKGNAVTTDDLAGYGITTISIDMKDVDVNIIGGSEKSYVEFVNINPARYDYTVSGYKMYLETVNPFDVTSLIKIRKNSSGFSGLRSYIFLNKYDDVDSAVNIYLAGDVVIGEMKVKVENGNVNIKNLTLDCMYDLFAENGNVNIAEVTTPLDCIVDVKEGDLNVQKATLKKVEFNVVNGDANFADCYRSHYYVTSESGIVYFDGENQGDTVKEIFPEHAEVQDPIEGEEGEAEQIPEQEQDQEHSLPGEVNGKVKNGNVNITSDIIE